MEHTFIESSSAKVQGEVWLSPDDLAPLHELVCAKGIAFLAQPSKFRTNGALISWSDTVKPVVSGDEIASWIADYRTVELLECFNDILTKAIAVRKGVSWLVESAIYTATHMSTFCYNMPLYRLSCG